MSSEYSSKSAGPKRVKYLKVQKTNMSPENQWLEDVFPIEIVPFLGNMLFFRVVKVQKCYPLVN